MPKRAGEWLAAIVVATLLSWILYSGGACRARQDITADLPLERDLKLVGRWRVEEGVEIHEFVFSPDGKGGYGGLPGLTLNNLRWGTRRGVLFIRYLASDYWPKVEYPYRLSGDGAELHLQGVKPYGPYRPILKRMAGK